MPLAVLLVRVERGSCRPVSRAQRGEKCCAAAVLHRDHVGWLGAHLPVTDTVPFGEIGTMDSTTGVL